MLAEAMVVKCDSIVVWVKDCDSEMMVWWCLAAKWLMGLQFGNCTDDGGGYGGHCWIG